MNEVTRRQILRAGAASVAAGMSVAGCSQMRGGSPAGGPSAAAPALAPGEPIRTGFIGIGGRGTQLLTAHLKQQGRQVVAVCDINKDNLNRAAKRVQEAQGKAPDTYSNGPDDFKRLLERKDLHAVVTATPCYEHARIMLATLAAGKHIYGEKPLALTVRDCDAIVHAAEARPRLVAQVGFQWMANPKFIETIQRVQQGQIGELIEGRFFRHSHAPPLKGWFSRREKSGDWMLEQACHEYNVMNWLARATPLRAYGLGRSDLFTAGEPDRNVTDFYAAIIEFPNNFIVHYSHGWISPEGFNGMEQKVVGTKGAIVIGGDRISWTDKKKKPESIKVAGGDDTEAAQRAYLESIREGKPAVAPVTNGRNASLLALMVRKAVYERRVVTWNEMLRTC